MKYFLFSLLMIVLIACQSEVAESEVIILSNQKAEKPKKSVIETPKQEEVVEISKRDNCYCDKNPHVEFYYYCDTIKLKDKSLLYYQYTCDSVWLTLNYEQNKKWILTSYNPLDKDQLIELHHRLRLRFIKEYSNHLLFRSYCPSDYRYCLHTLIEKKTGKVIKDGVHLIYDFDENDNPKFYDFLLYFEEVNLKKNQFNIIIEYVETNQKIKIPLVINYRCKMYMERLIESTDLQDKILSITYREYEDYTNCKDFYLKTIKIDLKKERLIK